MMVAARDGLGGRGGERGGPRDRVPRRPRQRRAQRGLLVLGRQGEDVAVVRARREERKRPKQERQLGRKAIRQAAAVSRGS